MKDPQLKSLNKQKRVVKAYRDYLGERYNYAINNPQTGLVSRYSESIDRVNEELDVLKKRCDKRRKEVRTINEKPIKP